MSRKGDGDDRRSQWRVFLGTLKNELIHHCRYKTREQAIREITEYIEGSQTGKEGKRGGPLPGSCPRVAVLCKAGLQHEDASCPLLTSGVMIIIDKISC